MNNQEWLIKHARKNGITFLGTAPYIWFTYEEDGKEKVGLGTVK